MDSVTPSQVVQNPRSNPTSSLLCPSWECPDQRVGGQTRRQDDLATALAEDLIADSPGHRLRRQDGLFEVLTSIRQHGDHVRSHPEGMDDPIIH